MKREVILMNTVREKGCNEELYDWLRRWSGWMTGNSVRNEAGNKV